MNRENTLLVAYMMALKIKNGFIFIHLTNEEMDFNWMSNKIFLLVGNR